MFNISPLSNVHQAAIEQKINNKTKPLGALGQLEALASQLVKIYTQNKDDINDFCPQITNPQLIVFAGDHGVASKGVSIAPSEVTGQMVANFAQGGAAINVFCQQLGWQLSVVDCGILQAPAPEFNVLEQRLGTSTHAFHQQPAMSIATVAKGFRLANSLIKEKHLQGCNLIAFGEMGIGNTTSASAIMSALLGIPAYESVGKGTGVSDEVMLTKQQIIEQALTLHQDSLSDPIEILACFGGFEIVQMTGAMLAAAERKMAIVIDGFISTAAALVAIAINADVKDYFIFAHCSGEQGHQKMLDAVNAKPLLNLGMRLGEGTGAALCLPLIQSALAFYNDMASFEQAAVTDVR